MEKQIDINNLSEKDFKKVEAKIKKRVKAKIEKTVADLNKTLNLYGLEALLGVQIVKQGEANLIRENALKE